MAGYENSMALFTGALGTATVAAMAMPYAWPIVGLMSMVNGDPAEQDRGSDQWLNPNSVNTWPASNSSGSPLLRQTAQQEWRPPMPANPTPEGGQSDIAFLRAELKRLTKEIGESGDWAGEMYTAWIEKVNVLDGHLAKLDDNRIACGETLNCSAQAYHAVLMFWVGMAGVLGACAAFVTAARISVVGAASGEAAAMRAVLSLHQRATAVFQQHWKLVLKVSLLLNTAGIAYNQFAQDLPGIQAVPTAKPNLVEARTAWDPLQMTIGEDQQAALESGALEKPSFLPEFGW
ncbi:hypothetical protein [Nonomuraea candida]|uniref:hypothetical protein n=1 Tax=Nonomuraea candida TaxID=359159 RepID=UPI0005B7A2FB|nr:hypothetical protein [Nonomuraea candida]